MASRKECLQIISLLAAKMIKITCIITDLISVII